MRQVRGNVFETNSSSTHSLTIMMKSDYLRWDKENLYLYSGSGWGYEYKSPVINTLYTRDEAVEFAKYNRYYRDKAVISDSVLKDMGFVSLDDEGSEYLESFYKEFTPLSGETIVAFGEYGYDG